MQTLEQLAVAVAPEEYAQMVEQDIAEVRRQPQLCCLRWGAESSTGGAARQLEARRAGRSGMEATGAEGGDGRDGRRERASRSRAYERLVVPVPSPFLTRLWLLHHHQERRQAAFYGLPGAPPHPPRGHPPPTDTGCCDCPLTVSLCAMCMPESLTDLAYFSELDEKERALRQLW